MLNKDEYNQDEYNDYYAQEVRGAEISTKEDEGSIKKIVIILLLLLLIVAVGYFGFNSINSSTPNEATEKSNTIPMEESTEVEKSVDTLVEAPQESTQVDKIKEQVEESIASSDGSKDQMNSEDIANIVQMVMMKMNKEETDEPTNDSSTSSKDQVEDNQLMESLSGADVDSLSSISENDDKKKPTLDKDVDIYNKIVLKENTANNADMLSLLSDEISNIIDTEDSEPTKDNNYTALITKEVKTRKQEMRYYIIVKGDTLGKVAKKFYGNVMEYKKIYQANPDILRRPDKIYIGQKLRIP